MAVTTRVRKIANPRRKSRKRLTAKQIKFFGTKRQRAALKSNHRRKRTVSRARPKHRVRTRAASNPKRRRTRVRTVTKTVVKYRYKTKPKAKANRRRSRKRNPAPVILTLGATNPRRRMAQKRKRKNTRHYKVRARSRNPKRVTRRRRSTVSHRRNTRRVARRRSRNPILGRQTVETVGGVLVGMAGTKFVPTLVPASLSAMGGSTFGPVLVSGLSAFVLKKVAEMVKKGAFSEGVFLGGLAQTGSVLLSALVPSIWGQYGIGGLGAFVPGRFPVPQNPVTAGRMLGAAAAGQVSASNARIGVSGLARAFGSAL